MAALIALMLREGSVAALIALMIREGRVAALIVLMLREGEGGGTNCTDVKGEGAWRH